MARNTEPDLTDFIARVNEMKARVPALNEEGPQEQRALADGDDSLTCLLRRSNDGTSWALTVINPDPHARDEAALDGIDVDLGAATEVTPGREGARVGDGNRLSVEPGEVRVFASM